MEPALFSPSLRNKNNPPQEKFLTLQQTKSPKKFLMFSQKKAVLIFQEVTFKALNIKKPTLKKLIFQEMEPFNPWFKKKFIYQEGTLKSQV